jgi:hypothetical protein
LIFPASRHQKSKCVISEIVAKLSPIELSMQVVSAWIDHCEISSSIGRINIHCDALGNSVSISALPDIESDSTVCRHLIVKVPERIDLSITASESIVELKNKAYNTCFPQKKNT